MSKINDDSRAKNRPKRVSIADQARLTVDSREGYVRHLIADRGDNIDRHIKAGWTIVQEQVDIGERSSSDASRKGSMNRKVLNRRTDGLEGVLMEIPEEWYKEDRQKGYDQHEALIEQINPLNQSEFDYKRFKKD